MRETDPVTPLDDLMAREQIRQLVYRYSTAIADRDVDLMASLYVADASFGPYGQGPAALREIMGATMGDLSFGVILVANHLIELDDDQHAHGEVWARCHAQNAEGYYEQLIKYVDRYRLERGAWLFEHRKHLLWFGEARDSPLAQPPADWPARQVGVGQLALADETVREWRASVDAPERGSS